MQNEKYKERIPYVKVFHLTAGEQEYRQEEKRKMESQELDR
jgi:hypothetical protein